MAHCKICNKWNSGKKNYCGTLKDPNSCYYKHSLHYKKTYRKKREEETLHKQLVTLKRTPGSWSLQWLNCY